MNHIKLIHESPKDRLKTFQIINWGGSNVNYAVSVAMGLELGKNNNISDLPAVLEFELTYGFASEISELRKNKTRFFLVFDVTKFPYISCYIDTDDSKFRDGADDIDVQTRRLWSLNSDQHVILITVNLNNHFTGLKHIPYK